MPIGGAIAMWNIPKRQEKNFIEDDIGKRGPKTKTYPSLLNSSRNFSVISSLLLFKLEPSLSIISLSSIEVFNLCIPKQTYSQHLHFIGILQEISTQ